MIRIAEVIDIINDKMGKVIAWLALFMVLAMFLSVLARYAFNATSIWQQELVRFMHAILFLAASGYTLLQDKHVRVDVFYHKLSEIKQAWVNLIGSIIFLFPVCLTIMYFSGQFIINSWTLFESSSEYMGMPGVFILKTFIWVFSFVTIMQGIANIIKNLYTIKTS